MTSLQEDGEVQIPARLQEVAEYLSNEPAFARFELFFSAAATAIEVLGDLEISQYESDSSPVDATELLHILGPTIEETLNSINAFLECVKSLFAVELHESDNFDALMGTAFVELENRVAAVAAAPSETAESQLEEVTAVLQMICNGLGYEVNRFRQGVVEPAITSDRWLLLDHIAMFRGKFRSGIGAMLFLTARMFAKVKRHQVIPGYADEVDAAVKLRRGLALMRDRLRLYLSTIGKERHGAALRTWIARLLKELEEFCTTLPFAHMRAADKRLFLGCLHNVRELLAAHTMTRRRVMMRLDSLTRLLESLSVINRREALIVHDAAAFERISGFLDQAHRSAEQFDLEAARSQLQGAVRWYERLVGYDERIDALSRLLRSTRLPELDAESIVAVVQIIMPRSKPDLTLV